MLELVRPLSAQPSVAEVLVPGPITRPGARDDVALDRRGGPRPRMVLDEIDPPIRAVDRFTASTHRPLPLLMGVAVPRIGDTPGGWLIARGLSWADGGALLLALDPAAPPLDPIERLARRAWADLWRHVHACVPCSPLQVISACVRVPALLAAIAAARPDAALAVELLPLLATGPADAATDAPAVTPVPSPTRLTARLAPLADPHPGVLAVAMTPAALARLVSPT
ncbi:MAG: hypothetical protein K1X88_22535, partial [Nannocystaceae bacterium]|nr:hypothetical protein [Nannocystaceae bacterium]